MFPLKAPAVLLLSLILPFSSVLSSPLSAQLTFGSLTGPSEVEVQNAIAAAPCKQAKPIMPKGYNVSKVLSEKERIIDWLSGAVQIPTEVFDEMGPVDSDPKWHIFKEFHAYLEKSFPLVHKNLKRSVHNWALVYEWTGSDPSLKATFLTSHQDVVPVLPETLPQWDIPPYSGKYDGKYLWGRGASDTKGSLIAIMSAIEHLLETTDFKPTRTVILGFGSDEERGGQVGAPSINQYIVEKYGKDSVALLIDEGSGLIETWGQQFGMPAVAEKGHYDLGLQVETLGGHSSVPPPHTGIGYLAMLIAQLEAHPHEPILHTESPVYGFMTCAAEFAADMPEELKHSVKKAEGGDVHALMSLPELIIKTGMGKDNAGPGQGNTLRAMMTTTQATDLIGGGVKVNALPEVARAVINHRVNIVSNHSDLEAHVVKTLLPVVKTYNLTLVDFDSSIAYQGNPSARVVLSEAFGYYTDPSPRSPTDISDPAWNVLAGTARGMWSSRNSVSEDGAIVELGPGEDLVMAPFMSTGNTDTRRYWDLTRNIYRFRYVQMVNSAGAHTINEKTSIDDIVEFTRFYQAIILNMDQAKEVA